MNILIAFKIKDVECSQGMAEELWQAKLHIQATFSVELEDSILLEQPYWAIVEQAISLAAWVRAVSDTGPNFSYTSMDDQQEGLLTFNLIAPDQWVIGSAWQEYESRVRYSTFELVSACRRYIAEVLKQAKPYMSAQIFKEVRHVLN